MSDPDMTVAYKPEAAVPQNIHQAIHNVKASLAISGIGKTGFNKEQKYAYRGIDDVMIALSELFVKERINIIPRVTHKESIPRMTKGGAGNPASIVSAEFDLVSVDDGSMVTVTMPGEGMAMDDKGTNKATSFAFKNAMMILFIVPVRGVLDEGDAESPGMNEPDDRRPDRQQRQQDRPRNDRGSGGARGGGGQSQANNRQQESDPAADAKKYLRTLLGKLAQCDSDDALDELQSAEGRGIARLRAEFRPLFDEWDNKLGLKSADIGGTPF